MAEAEGIPPGSRMIVRLQGREIGIFNVAGKYFAVRNLCAHQGGPLCEGALVGSLRSARPGEYEFDDTRKFLECPWHGWEYDLETGQSWFDPMKTKVASYDVHVESGAVLESDPRTGMVKGPYAVETYPVSVERDYVVLDVKG